jgi:hypothetical protein
MTGAVVQFQPKGHTMQTSTAGATCDRELPVQHRHQLAMVPCDWCGLPLGDHLPGFVCPSDGAFGSATSRVAG